MPQSLIQLPESADIEIVGWGVTIRDHKVVSWDGLFSHMVRLVRDYNRGIQDLVKFEKHGISFECAIEESVRELEQDIEAVARILSFCCFDTDACSRISKSKGGRNIADRYIEKIRNCENWGELYDEIHPSSKFSKDMRNRIIKEIKKENKKNEEVNE